MSPDQLAPEPTASDAPEVPGYRLGEPLGRGSVGVVWAAARLADGLRVAIKVVPVAQPEQARSLARELAVLGRVEVEGLVRFHEAVCVDADSSAVALVLDHVGGGSLERAVRARGYLSVGESVTVLTPVARTLAGLHALGVVHGDVTPANVLLERSGRPVLTDLGLARLVGEGPGDQSGYLWGTEGFVAPEVFADGVCTTAADVYAVGALAWWCVTGAAPGPGALRLPLAEVAPGLPKAWSELTTRALLGDPALRPSAAELALAYYDSAPCEPLRLVVGNDETSLLTQRLRRPVPPAENEPVGRRDVRDMARTFLLRRAGALLTLLVLVTVLGVGGLVAAGVLGAPGWLRHAGSGPGAGTAAPPTTAPTRAPTTTVTTAGTAAPTVAPTRASGTTAPAVRDPLADRTAPARDPRGLMVALAALRAEAMNSRSSTVLAELDAPGSAALAQDRALVDDLVSAGTVWAGVRLEVTSARTVTHTADAASVEAVVGTAAYRVVGEAGSVTTRAAVPGERMRFALVWSGGRWRVDRVSGTGG